MPNTASSPVAESKELYPTEFSFFSLPRPVQDRFIASVTGAGVPSPILFEPAPADRAWRWVGTAIASAAVLVMVAAFGFGQLGHQWALQPKYLIVIYAALSGLALVSVLLYLHARSASQHFPYRQGRYLFPVGVVTVRGDRLSASLISGLQRIESKGSRVALVMAGQRFSFTLPPGLSKERLEQQMSLYRTKFAEARVAEDRKLLATLDPVRDSGFSNPLSSRDQLAPEKDARGIKVVVALLLGGAIGVMGFFARDTLAERRLFRAAFEENSSRAFEQYMAAGGSREKVRTILLPRSQLKERRGSLEAVEQFAAVHETSPIRPEIDVALREELLAALKEVAGDGTLKALKSFTKKHAQHRRVEREINEARTAIYAAAERSFLTSYQASPKVEQLVSSLIDHSKQHGPLVEVRFRRYLPRSTERADNSIRKSAYFTGNHATPSQYFRASHAAPREEEAAVDLLSFLQAPFSAEVLQFRLGAPLEGEPSSSLPEVSVPTFFVSYSTEVSGGYTTQRPRGVYVGLGMTFRVRAELPSGSADFQFRHSSWLPPDVNVIWHEKLTPKDVYDRNARLGFRRFLSNFKLELFSRRSEPLVPEQLPLASEDRPEQDAGLDRARPDGGSVDPK